MHRLTIKRYFLFFLRYGVIVKKPVPEFVMSLPHYHAETDLNAENLLRLPAEFGCP
ncbi:diaminopimelate decarboxylase, partial [Salmonella enterica]|nr:diaminopimelate decarboxylase [Salmonella enterica]